MVLRAADLHASTVDLDLPLRDVSEHVDRDREVRLGLAEKHH